MIPLLALTGLAACAGLEAHREVTPGVHEYRIKLGLVYWMGDQATFNTGLSNWARETCDGPFSIADRGVRSIPGSDESEHVWLVTCGPPASAPPNGPSSGPAS